MSTTSRLGQLRRLSRAERRVLAQALVLLPLACVGLKMAGLKRTQSFLSSRAGRGPSALPIDPRVVARMVSIAQRHGPCRVRCLAAAVTLQSILHRAGIDAELRLGVRKHHGRLEAHAWIEHEGTPLMERADVGLRFAAFDRPIAPTAR